MAAAAGAAAAGVVAAGGGGTQTVTAPPSPPAQQQQPTPPPPPAPASPTANSFNGDYSGNLSVTDNGCRFAPSPRFSARLDVNSAGHGTLRFTYVDSNQQQHYVFDNVNVTMNGAQGTFEARTVSSQFGYTLIVQGNLSGNSLTGRVSFFDSSRGNCHTGFVMNGTRQ